MSYDLVITGKIVDTEKTFNASICIEGDKIARITREGVSAKKEIKTPAYIFPGFIELYENTGPSVHTLNPPISQLPQMP